MTILTRFKDIMSSNINALLDKAENPEKMIDQVLRNLNKDLGAVKAETASIMAQEQRAKRELDECIEEVNKMERYAVKALEANNEDDARKFLERKVALTAKQSELQESYNLSQSNATRMREMHDKLVADIGELESRKTMIKGKMAVAKTQDRINQIGSSVNSANRSISAFERMEEKANKVLDEANAMAELNRGPKDDIKDLTAKYDTNTDIDDELEELKKRLNK
ncbi:PspA/IM30 family protein [Tissierella pigra]|uniref:PspA/IM30 family protein n=1 Tax=Tissierella pigra TaxID=2607614 RepID=A0A6N7Y0X9_9FIRM|nr:PspA/IM30 family protein [Tissierella pigra]MBU5426745.1 PspA/IM30 family protein [Tissierella pigra]MSU02504.1 PspA/IM30 family protein [Tissierella pigra]